MEDIRTFTSEEKMAFLAALHYASTLNGVTNEETEFISNLAEEFGISETEAKQSLEHSSKEQIMDMLDVFTDRRHKLELIKELFFLGYADGNLTDEELMFVASVGNKMGIDDDVLEDISRWVIAGIEWQEEGERIFGADS
jgi:hypothetical protein